MRIVFFGTPLFAVPSLKALLDSNDEVIAVVTQPGRHQGRGHRLVEPPVRKLADERRIPVIQPAGIRTAGFLEEVSRMVPDVIAVVAYGKILPPALLKLPPLGCVNVHASLLPKYRGAAPIQWSLISGERVTGVTTMQMDEGLDTGDILLHEETEISEDDNAETLGQRLSGLGASLLVRTLERLRTGSLRPVAQEGEPSFAPPLKKADGHIDWSRSAREIVNLIRGTFPWPGAFCFLGSERITFVRAKVSDDSGVGVPGRVERISGDDVFVSTGKGLMAVSAVKPDGRRAMSASAYVRGKRLGEGMRFDV